MHTYIQYYTMKQFYCPVQGITLLIPPPVLVNRGDARLLYSFIRSLLTQFALYKGRPYASGGRMDGRNSLDMTNELL